MNQANQMSSANSNKSNGDPNRDGRGGRGRRKRESRHNGGGVDQTAWRALGKPYREWLISSGLAVNAAAFNDLSFDQKRSLNSDYAAERTAVARTAEQSDLSDLITLLRYTLISQTNPYAVISDSHYSAQDSPEVKTASMAFYGLPDERFCQILGQQPEQIKIVNAHVWPRSGTATLPLFDLKTKDIHNPRNVLRLHKDIERAFDGRELVFVAGANDRLVVKVLSPYLPSKLLTGTQQRFAEIDGAPLQIKSAGALPYRRLLAHHSVLAHRWAREQGWITDDLAAEEVNAGALMEHSLDQQAQDRIRLLWRK
jgi:hypothetical protein